MLEWMKERVNPWVKEKQGKNRRHPSGLSIQMAESDPTYNSGEIQPPSELIWAEHFWNHKAQWPVPAIRRYAGNTNVDGLAYRGLNIASVCHMSCVSLCISSVYWVRISMYMYIVYTYAGYIQSHSAPESNILEWMRCAQDASVKLQQLCAVHGPPILFLKGLELITQEAKVCHGKQLSSWPVAWLTTIDNRTLWVADGDGRASDRSGKLLHRDCLQVDQHHLRTWSFNIWITYEIFKRSERSSNVSSFKL